MIEAKPENLIGDRAYDSDKLDDELREDGIEMIAPHRSNRKKRKTQDGRRLRRYERRWSHPFLHHRRRGFARTSPRTSLRKHRQAQGCGKRSYGLTATDGAR